MLYFIIAILVIVIFYLLTSKQSSSSKPLVMSSKYNGLVSHILTWNKTSKVVQDEVFLITIKATIMVEGESVFTLFEKGDGDLEITYKTTGVSSVYGNVNVTVSYPQNVCVTNYDLVWAAVKEHIENALLEKTKKITQRLFDDFYGI